jgi:hypothetical protein
MDLFTYFVPNVLVRSLPTLLLKKPFLSYHPRYTMEGFDLTTHNSKDGDDATM